MIYLQLFVSFLQVGLFSIGGGYAAIPIIQSQVIDKYNWLTMSQFSDLASIAEMTPGPIALNAATFVGSNIAGFPGAIVATAGCVLPSLLIVSALFFIYKKFGKLESIQKILSFLRPAVISFIASAGVQILLNVLSFSGFQNLNTIDFTAMIIFIVSFVSIRRFKINPILVMILSGVVYTTVNLIFR